MFTFTNVPQTVKFYQIAVAPPSTSGVAKLVPIYKNFPYDPSKGSTFSITQSDLNQLGGPPLVFSDPGVYVISVTSTVSFTYNEDLKPVGPKSDGLYAVTVLPQTFDNVTAAVVQSQPGVANTASVVQVTNNYTYDLSATVQFNYNYLSAVGAQLAALPLPVSIPYVLPAGATTSTLTLPPNIGAGSPSVTVTIDGGPLDGGKPFPLNSPTSVKMDPLPSIAVKAPILTSCSIKAGTNRTLEILGATSSFEIDTITITHPDASSEISPYVNPPAVQAATAFGNFMKSAGSTSVPVGTFNAEIVLGLPSVGTLGASRVTIHNASAGGGTSNTVTCQ